MKDADRQIIALLEQIKALSGGGGGSVSWGQILGTLSNQTDLQNALNAKLATSALDTDDTLSANSDAKVPSQKAVKAYVDANAGGSGGVIGTLQISVDSMAETPYSVIYSDGVLAGASYSFAAGVLAVTFASPLSDAYYIIPRPIATIAAEFSLSATPDVNGFQIATDVSATTIYLTVVRLSQ